MHELWLYDTLIIYKVMRELIATKKEFTEMLSGFIQSGVTFTSHSNDKGNIVITFNGGY